MTEIPVRNLWLLQLFASDLYQSTGREFSGIEKLPVDVAQLISRILADAVSERMHTGLTVGFQRTTADLTRVRGKIDIAGTVRDRLLDRGRVRCTFDRVHPDTLPNRLVRTALERATRLPETDARCRNLASQLSGAGVGLVSAPFPDLRDLYRQRHLFRDREMLMAARLLLELALPDPGVSDYVSVSPEDEERYLRKLFEKAVFGFYRRNLNDNWKATHGTRLKWPVEISSTGFESILPGMQTDIILRNDSGRIIIIDTKFTSVTATNQYGTERLKSGYLYQMYAYLLSQHDNPHFGPHSEGLMLHPVVDGHTDEEAQIQGHRFRFATVDLRGTYDTIVPDLLEAVRAGTNSAVNLSTPAR